MDALTAADGRRMETACQLGKDDSKLASAEQERRRQMLARYDNKLEVAEKAKRATVYDLHRQLSSSSLFASTGTVSGAKWIKAQSRIDSRISTRSIDEMFDDVAYQKRFTSLLRRDGGCGTTLIGE